MPVYNSTTLDRFAIALPDFGGVWKRLTLSLHHFRRALERQVWQRYGQISYTQTLIIDVATQHHGQRLRAAWYLRKATERARGEKAGPPKLPMAEMMMLGKVLVTATRERNKEVAKLKLGEGEQDMAAALYGSAVARRAVE